MGVFDGSSSSNDMSVSCGVECVLLLGCLRWACKRCTYIGSYDSATWPPATASEFEPVPRLCRLILAVYEDDLRHPQFPPSGGYRLNPEWVIKRLTYQQTLGHAPPYLIYADHLHREIVLAIRGLSLVKESDYKLMLDNRLGMQMFDGGYVHHGLLKSAIWILNEESETLRRLWVDNGSSYKMVFTGHSLGSGVAALLTVIVVNHLDLLGGIPRSNVRCYSVAPARCMSLNLAVKYADVIHSVVLQLSFHKKAEPFYSRHRLFVKDELFLLSNGDSFRGWIGIDELKKENRRKGRVKGELKKRKNRRRSDRLQEEFRKLTGKEKTQVLGVIDGC
ncbi:hypothetical protein HYC85_006007 [Camellia sinensis]|uniref:Fungal lipase-like domain-containing protein n=1 Tax=Camellia sinensis TaxID=4442 RepID=A0A7J7I147_CAMSI|nr:hypothetical protein HYC85_006007 [Camellia sinensis]